MDLIVRIVQAHLERFGEWAERFRPVEREGVAEYYEAAFTREELEEMAAALGLTPEVDEAGMGALTDASGQVATVHAQGRLP